MTLANNIRVVPDMNQPNNLPTVHGHPPRAAYELALSAFLFPMAKLIPLTGKRGKGKFAIVDDDYFDHLMQWKWYYDHKTNHACRGTTIKGVDLTVRMHREIMGLPRNGRNPLVDHRDGNGLNNQKENLRVTNQSRNCQNRRWRSPRSETHPFKGVEKTGRKFRARIKYDGKNRIIGAFSTAQEAADAYDAAAIEHFGEFAVTNAQLKKEGLLIHENEVGI